MVSSSTAVRFMSRSSLSTFPTSASLRSESAAGQQVGDVHPFALVGHVDVDLGPEVEQLDAGVQRLPRHLEGHVLAHGAPLVVEPDVDGDRLVAVDLGE